MNEQPENLKIDLISKCLKIFSENDDVYKIISFNGFKNNDSGKERVASTILEEMYINEKYSKGGVKKFIFPQENQNEYDNFLQKYEEENNQINLLKNIEFIQISKITEIFTHFTI